MRVRTVAASVLTASICLVFAGCITLSDPRVAPEGQDGLSTLTLQPDGPGAISIPGMGVNCTSVCTVPVEPGSLVNLAAVPSGSQGFAGWAGANCSGENSCSIRVEDDMTIKAVFANYFLDVDVEGGGTVHVSPPGIDCSSDCIIRFDEPIEVKVEKKTEETEIQDWGGLCEDAVNSICVVNVDGKTEVEVETETETEITNPPPSGDPPTDDGTTDEGTTDDGATDDGTTDDGATDDGTTDDGTTDDGTTDDGATDDGTTDDGTTDDGTTDDGTTDDGTTDDGTTDNGTTDDGTTDDGATDDGTTDDGATDDGTTGTTDPGTTAGTGSSTGGTAPAY